MNSVQTIFSALTLFATAVSYPSFLQDGRPLSFDRLGLISLERSGPLDKDHKRILEDIRKWELAQATRNARTKLLTRFDDFHAAWLLVQASRLRGTIDGTIRDLEALLAQDSRRVAVQYALIRLHDSIRMEGIFYQTGDHTGEERARSDFRYAELLKEWRKADTRKETQVPKVPLPIFVAIAEDRVSGHQTAIAHVDAYIRQNGEDDGLRLYQAERLMSGKAPDMDRAEGILRKLRNKKPGLKETLYFLADLRLRQGKRKESIALFQAFIASTPDNPILLARAREFVRTGDVMAIRRKLPV